jgi:hypothetical protein
MGFFFFDFCAGRGEHLPCKSCGKDSHGSFPGEIAIHFPGLKNIDKPTVVVFPELVICLNCGLVAFTVPEDELRLLARNSAASAG